MYWYRFGIALGLHVGLDIAVYVNVNRPQKIFYLVKIFASA